MGSLYLGMIILVVVFMASGNRSDLLAYAQPHSLIIVAGGTFATLLLANPMNVLRSLIRASGTLLKKDESFSHYQADLIKLTQNRAMSQSVSKNTLIFYAQELWAQGIDPDLFIVLLSQKRKELESRLLDSVQALKNLAKYPPAFGMCGTVMGMIGLFSKLDENRDHIGSHLSLAMTATFFGLILTNALISPMADRLHVKHVSQQRMYEAVYEILLLINRGEAPSLIREEMGDRSN